MAKLDANYPGGLKGYVTNARALLEASSSGANPMEGVTAVEVKEDTPPPCRWTLDADI